MNHTKAQTFRFQTSSCRDERRRSPCRIAQIIQQIGASATVLRSGFDEVKHKLEDFFRDKCIETMHNYDNLDYWYIEHLQDIFETNIGELDSE